MKRETEELRKEKEKMRNENARKEKDEEVTIEIVKERKKEKEDRKNEMKEMREEIYKLEGKIKTQEREKRRKNVVIRGIEKGERTTKEAVEEVIKGRLRMIGGIKNVKMIGKTGSEALVELDSLETKIELMSRRSSLKGSSIYLDDDLSWEERQVQRELRKEAMKEREKGKKVIVRYGRICVDGRWIKWEEIEKSRRGGGEEEKAF